jgi:hypothetical protein
MNNYDFSKVVSLLAYFRQELDNLLHLLEKYESANYESKNLIHAELITNYKSFKDELKKQLKVLIQYDANFLVSDHLLPPLSVAFTYLQDIGVNRINPNSIHKVIQQVKKAYIFIEKSENKLKITMK